MQVGIIGPTGPDRFAENIGAGFHELGHRVKLLGSARNSKLRRISPRFSNVAQQAIPSFDGRVQRHIARAALDSGCELVVNVDSRLVPEAVAMLKREGVKIVFWFPDAVVNIGRQLMLLSPYDAIFFKEPQLVDRLCATLDLPIYYLPQGCNPRLHRALVPAGTDPYLVIAGNMYPSRVRLLERLLDKGIPLRLYGASVPRWITSSAIDGVHAGRAIFGEEKAKVFRSAAGVLNTMHPAEEAGVNVRVFEAAGCGAAVLSEFRPTIPELFDVGDELLAFRDFDDLVEQANQLLTVPGLPARLGDAATRRAHRDHSYACRVRIILEKAF